MPVIGFINGGSADASTAFVAAFRKDLAETGFVEGQNVKVEYHWLEGKYDQLPALAADLVSRRVALITTSTSTPAGLAAKAATATIPIVFGVAQDPVELGLVASLGRPGGNPTGINFFNREVPAKRLRLLHDLVPMAVRVAVLLNPANRPKSRRRHRRTAGQVIDNRRQSGAPLADQIGRCQDPIGNNGAARQASSPRCPMMSDFAPSLTTGAPISPAL